MKRIVFFLIFIGAVSTARANICGDLFHLLTCNYFRSEPSEQELLRSIGHKNCYERGVIALLNPIYDFLVRQKRQYPDVRFAVVFDVDGTVFYPETSERKEAVFNFYSRLQLAGFYLFFISSRPSSDDEATRWELRLAHYDAWHELILMPDALRDEIDQIVDPIIKTTRGGEWKSAMRKCIEVRFGVTVAATFDDEPACLFGEALGFPVWIPGYLALREHYNELCERHARLIAQKLGTR